MFWQIMHGFSVKEKELLLRFVWGRSRLPLSQQDFTQKFEIMTCHINNDNVLPLAHTCFFQLELPRYTTIEIMKAKLLYAITSCIEVDMDGVAQNNAVWGGEGDDD
jgi:hypothetical protein